MAKTLNNIKSHIFKYFETLIKCRPFFKKPVLVFYHAYLIHQSKQFDYCFYRKRNRLYIPNKYLLVIHYILIGEKKNYYPNSNFCQITKKKQNNPIVYLERNLSTCLISGDNSINSTPFSANYKKNSIEKIGSKNIDNIFSMRDQLSAAKNISFIENIYYTSQLNVNIHIKSYDCSTTIKSIAFYQKEISTKIYHLLSSDLISINNPQLIFLKLNNPYMPIYLKAFYHNHDEQSYCIPFPSLARNGIHYPECQAAIKSSYMDTFFFLQNEYFDKYKSLDKTAKVIKVRDVLHRYSDVIFSPLYKKWLKESFNIDIIKTESKSNLMANQLPAICAMLDKKLSPSCAAKKQTLIIANEQERNAITIQYQPLNIESLDILPVVIHNIAKNHLDKTKTLALLSKPPTSKSSFLSNISINVILFSKNKNTEKKQRYLLQQQKGIRLKNIYVFKTKNNKNDILKINAILKESKTSVLFIDERINLFNPYTIISLKHNLMNSNVLSISPLCIEEININYSKKINLYYDFYIYHVSFKNNLTLIQPKENEIILMQSNTPVIPTDLNLTLVNPNIWNTLGGLVKNLDDLNTAFFHLALRAIHYDHFCLINKDCCIGISSDRKKTKKPPTNPLTISQSSIDKIKKNLMGIKDIA